MKRKLAPLFAIFFLSIATHSCIFEEVEQKPRETLFIGLDISGSFLRGKHFDDSLSFLSHYIYMHINGIGEASVPANVFVGSIGGSRPGEPKAFYPIDDFKYANSPDEIHRFLKIKFPKTKSNPFTDFNAFFKQIRSFVLQRKLQSKPTTILMISDGEPDISSKGKKIRKDFCGIDLKPLEKLTRNITLRLLYTSPTIGEKWKTLIPRNRVKIFTQDAEVMTSWKKKKIFQPQKKMKEKRRLHEWLARNVDLGVPKQNVVSKCSR